MFWRGLSVGLYRKSFSLSGTLSISISRIFVVPLLHHHLISCAPGNEDPGGFRLLHILGSRLVLLFFRYNI
jgi:hypothetical protein